MKTEKDIEEMLDNVKIPSDEEVEAAGVRFDRRLRRVRMRRRIIWSGSSVAAVLCCGLVFASLWVREKEEVPEADKSGQRDQDGSRFCRADIDSGGRE